MFSAKLMTIEVMGNASARYWIGAIAVFVIVIVIFLTWQLHSMSADLDRMSTRVEALSSMDRKLSVTNQLLLQTNASLAKMSVQSVEANRKLGSMQSDLAVMSHKIAGSFLFRGVK